MTTRTLRNKANHFGLPWRVAYTDATGRTQQLALGSAGTVLTSNGASAAPSWGAGGGGGGSGSFVLDDGTATADGTFEMDEGGA